MPTVENPIRIVGHLNPPKRLLCGPGPGNAHPRVHASMSLPQIGHMDPDFIAICNDVSSLLRYVWQTENQLTIPISGTGSAGWESLVANLTVPGDVHLVGANGYFGNRHCDMAGRYGATIKRMEKPWGEVFTLEEIKKGLETHKPQLLWLCHAETSTGTLQPLAGVAELCRQHDCLFLLDTVTSIGSVPVDLDKWGVDASYCGTQKCLSCPPGLAPVTLGPRALAKIDKRQGKVATWYLDLSMIRQYLLAPEDSSRVYHHTAPICMVYALREALTIVAEEGLENTFKRHAATAEYFWKLVEEAGLEMLIPDVTHRSPSIHTIKVPTGVNPGAVIKYLREKHCIEIGGGLGELAGKVFRVGLMGYNSRPEVALLIISAMKEAFAAQGWTRGK